MNIFVESAYRAQRVVRTAVSVRAFNLDFLYDCCRLVCNDLGYRGVQKYGNIS